MKNVRDYGINIKVSKEDGIVEYVAIFNDFKTIIGVGETASQAIEEAYGNLEAYFDFCESEGIEIPDPSDDRVFEEYNGRVTLRMPRALHRDIAEYAKKDGVSLNYIINDALRFYLGGMSLKEFCLETGSKIEDSIADLNNQIRGLSNVTYKSNFRFTNKYMNLITQ